MTRAKAARLAGMEQQALRDAVLRDNAEGLGGQRDCPRSGRLPRAASAIVGSFADDCPTGMRDQRYTRRISSLTCVRIPGRASRWSCPSCPPRPCRSSSRFVQNSGARRACSAGGRPGGLAHLRRAGRLQHRLADPASAVQHLLNSIERVWLLLCE